MKVFQARTAVPGEEQQYCEWLQAASDVNLVDTSVYAYPTCNTITVDMDNQACLMNSVHLVLVQEALAPKPGLPPKDEARALKELYRAVRNLAFNTQIKEVWFMCADERMFGFLERKGFERIQSPVFRIKVGGESDPFNEARPEGVRKENS